MHYVAFINTEKYNRIVTLKLGTSLFSDWFLKVPINVEKLLCEV